MKNTTELRKEMVEVFNKLKARKIDTVAAGKFVAISNSMIKSASLEADYNKFLGKKNTISFLATPK